MHARHCVGEDGVEAELNCARPVRDYNIPLRIGLLFVILVTSAIGECSLTTSNST
jgi:solute carrier family 39 (zinc transporter), member 1/2/3